MVIPVDIRSRLDYLAGAQNPDGGWGYLPGKSSWLEPTVYALLALHPSEVHRRVFERGWQLARSWQLPSGAWKPARQVSEPHWTTSLAITLHAVRGVHDAAFHKGVSWLLSVKGVEGGALSRIAGLFTSSLVEFDASLVGWPWLPDTSSWVEPTSQALLALKMAAKHVNAKHVNNDELRSRTAMAERMLLERRCHDGGWNYGNRKVYGVDLLCYPETTAIALIGLKGVPSPHLAGSLQLAARLCAESRSPLARAWLTIALQSHGRPVANQASDVVPDVLVTALQVIAWNRVLG